MKTVEQFSVDINEYWNRRIRDRESGRLNIKERDFAIPAMGLMGEAGEAGEHFKKFLRDGKPVWRKEELALELGDVLHYLCRCAYLAGYTIQEIAAMNDEKMTARRAQKGDCNA